MSNLLSICIPTYNRADYLNDCLGNIISEAREFDLPIYVLDNNSTDSTYELVQEYPKKYPHLEYSKQERTVSIDQNMLDVIELSNSQFCVWLGDDDKFKPGAIKKILDALTENEEVSFMLLNAELLDSHAVNGLGHYTINIQDNLSLNDPVVLFQEYWDKLPFGTLVIRRESLLSVKVTRFMETAHSYSGAVFEYLAQEYTEKKRCNILIMKDDLVGLRTGRKSWSHYSIHIFCRYSKMV